MAQSGQYQSYQPTTNGTAYNYNQAILPVASDVGVVTFRNWLRLLAGGMIPAPSSQVVFDVWNGHTKHCRYCLTALRRLKTARLVAFTASAPCGNSLPLVRYRTRRKKTDPTGTFYTTRSPLTVPSSFSYAPLGMGKTDVTTCLSFLSARRPRSVCPARQKKSLLATAKVKRPIKNQQHHGPTDRPSDE